MKRGKSKKKPEWLLNWNLLTIILGITLILEVVVVLISFDLPRKGYTILSLSIAVAVIGFFAYFNHINQRKVLLYIQGVEPLRFHHAGSYLNLILTVLISGSIFMGISYVISEYMDIPLYFSIPEVAFGVMLTVTKNVTAHEILGKTLLIRVSFIELYIPITNIESVKADDNRLPDLPKDLKIPRRYRAVSSYFGHRVLITLKNPQNLFTMGLPPFKKTKKILFDVDEPERFVTALLRRMGPYNEN
ncbi:MAG: hypothetical protein JSV56_13325 [Methanomassiliicoccales archaeon]|nr:MAG: hypothetical protein JSV56_13325 [Methanomassiliicoccales archaeon]